MTVEYRAEPDYRGQGISLGLARGLTAWIDRQNLTQEGMGLGTIAARFRGLTYFCLGSSTEEHGQGRIGKEFHLDGRIQWRIGAWRPPWLSRILEKTADAYMGAPKLQSSLLAAATVIRKKLRFLAGFIPTPPIAESLFDYVVRGPEVEITARVLMRKRGFSKLFILNELGADYFSRAWSGRREISPPSGWTPLPQSLPTPELYDPDHGARFSIRSLRVQPALPFKIFWGRENVPEYCWAGFEFELDLRRARVEELTLTYTVSIC
jgi:hypothetical protein